MDSHNPLTTSFASTLSAITQASHTVSDFIHDVPFARTSLDSITYELLDLRALLERLLREEPSIPQPLHGPILSLTAACRYVLASIDVVLADCGDDGPPRSGQWIGGAKDEMKSLKSGLQTCRRAIRLAREVVNLSTSIQFMASANNANPIMGAGVAEIKHDAGQILTRAYRVRAQVPLPQDNHRDVNRSSFGLQRGMHGLINFVESICAENNMSDVSYSQHSPSPSEAQQIQPYPGSDPGHSSPSSPLFSLSRVKRALSSISSSESNPNSFSSNESRRLSELSVSWFANEEEDKDNHANAPAIFSRMAMAPPRPRRPTNETVGSRREMGDLKEMRDVRDFADAAERHGEPGARGISDTRDSKEFMRNARDAKTLKDRRDAARMSRLVDGKKDIAAIAPLAPYSLVPGYSLYPPPPPPTRPLPAVPPQRSPSKGAAGKPTSPPLRPSRASKASSANTTSSSDGASSPSYASKTPLTPLTPLSPLPQASFSQISIATEPLRPVRATPDIELVPWKQLTHNEKDQGNISYVDVSHTSSFLASKHGNHMIRLWDLRTGTLANSIKVSFYVRSQARSRDYFVRSHAIVSETANLVAIASNFGHTLEIWDWGKRKKLQTIDDAYRWATVRGDVFETNWPPLAAYREDRDALDLYPVARDGGKKPFAKPRTIDLRLAGLPHLPKYPELAYSATGPLLIAAAGPRPPRIGQPPPEHGAMLMAWEVDGDPNAVDVATMHQPYKFVMPEQHSELGTGLPLCLATYGSVAVSIWIPASYRAVQGKGRTGGWQLEAVTVTSRHVLVWDFAANTTCTYSIPDVLACVSPDCRFVAYCDPKTGLVVLDATSGRELWRRPATAMAPAPAPVVGTGGKDPRASSSTGGTTAGSTTSGSGVAGAKAGFERLGDLSKVTELAFSAEGNLFFTGDGDGGVGVYEVRELKEEMI